MNNMKEFNPDWYSPPGDSIEALIEEKEWTIEQLSESLMLSVEDTHKLISGELSLSESIAGRLAVVAPEFSKEFWLKREEIYRRKKQDIESEQEIIYL